MREYFESLQEEPLPLAVDVKVAQGLDPLLVLRLQILVLVHVGLASSVAVDPPPPLLGVVFSHVQRYMRPVVVPQRHVLVNASGTQWDPVKGVSVKQRWAMRTFCFHSIITI